MDLLMYTAPASTCMYPVPDLLVAACILYIPVCMRARAAGKFVSSAKLVLYLFTGIYHKGITLWLGGIHLAAVQYSPFPGYLTSLTPNSRLSRPFAVTTYLHGSQGGSSKATVPGVIAPGDFSPNFSGKDRSPGPNGRKWASQRASNIIL